MAADTKNKLDMWTWPGDDLKDDPACHVCCTSWITLFILRLGSQNFFPRLLDHLLGRLLLGVEYDGDEKAYASVERSTVTVMEKTIYSHQVLRVNYTTY